MFQSARFKLTTWYILIIMLISSLFSIAIYQGLTHEIERSLRAQRFRLENHPGENFARSFSSPALDPQLLQESRDRIKFTLLLINGGILIVSGGAAYFLAGRTLKPIEVMVREQSRFITDSSHELLTPLTALKSEIEVNMRDKNFNFNQAKKLLNSNLEEVNNLQSLSVNLLQLAQFEKSNGKFTKELISLKEVLLEATKRVAPLAKQKDIEIKTLNSEVKFLGDFDQLVQLFVILLDNAIKYSPVKSTITINSKTLDHQVVINIQDEGVGIDEKDLPHIFDRFYRADKSRTKNTVPGYGLGLSIAKKIVDSHRGLISVKNTIGKGTTFTVQFPIKIT